MVQNAHGRGHVAAFAFIKNKTEPYIRRIFDALRQSNLEAVEKVRVVPTTCRQQRHVL